MRTVERPGEILTPDQAADYLQVDRETVYRHIRDGKLMASKLGRTYRIPRSSIDTLMWATPARPDIMLRTYSPEEVEQFIADDQLDPEAQEIARRLKQGMSAG
jgi:excisionase family DNA binding protein